MADARAVRVAEIAEDAADATTDVWEAAHQTATAVVTETFPAAATLYVRALKTMQQAPKVVFLFRHVIIQISVANVRRPPKAPTILR